MPLGGFSTEITVFEEFSPLIVHVVVDELIQTSIETELILGRDFFKLVEDSSSGMVIIDIKKINKNFRKRRVFTKLIFLIPKII